jgi:hypothetical protein
MAAPSDTTGSGPVPAGEVIEVDGLLWKPKSGATSSGEQFSRARSLLLEIHRDASWNPWVEEDRTQENQQATAVFEQWTRAEPGFPAVDLRGGRRGDGYVGCRVRGSQRRARSATSCAVRKSLNSNSLWRLRVPRSSASKNRSGTSRPSSTSTGGCRRSAGSWHSVSSPPAVAPRSANSVSGSGSNPRRCRPPRAAPSAPGDGTPWS